MKAAVYEGPGRLEIREVPDPAPTRDNLILRVRMCTICGTDLKLYTIGNPRCKPPRIIGHEFVGEVIAAGADVAGFALGDRVTLATSVACGRCAYCSRGLENLCPDMKCVSYDYDGAFAEYVEVPGSVVRRGNALLVPRGLEDKAAALAEPLSCVVNAQKIAGVKPGDTVVVVGAGPLGCLNAEAAKAFGACRVILTQTSPERLALARRLRDIEVIDVSGGDAVAQVRTLTNGEGADVVIVAAPNAQAQAQAIEMARKGGTVNLFASLPKGESTILVDTRIVHYGQIAITGASDSRPCDVRDALQLLDTGKIDVNAIVTHELPLDRILEGIAMMQRRSGLKIAVRP